MNVQLNSAIPESSSTGSPAAGSAVTGASAPTQVNPGGATAGKPPAETADGVRISAASTALKQSAANGSAKVVRLTGAVQGGSYVTSSAATSHAIVENILSGKQ